MSISPSLLQRDKRRLGICYQGQTVIAFALCFMIGVRYVEEEKGERVV